MNDEARVRVIGSKRFEIEPRFNGLLSRWLKFKKKCKKDDEYYRQYLVVRLEQYKGNTKMFKPTVQ